MSLFLVVGRAKDCDYCAMLKNGFGMGGVIARTLPNNLEMSSLIPSSIKSIEEKWMTYALLEAMNGIGWASPNPAVGCVIVKDGAIIAKGFTQSYGGLHAESTAFKSLNENFNLDSLSGLEVYVTLEPCTHFGKQPPCVDLLLHPSVQKIWIGCTDSNEKVGGKGIQLLKDAGKEVQVGVLKNEIQAWHYPFLKSIKEKKPIWVAKWAENQNGWLADAQGNSKWITNQSSRAYTHWLRQKYDAILVGARTWLQDQPKLNVRDCAEPHRRNPVILIHDPKHLLHAASTEASIHIFHQERIEDLILAVEQSNFGFELQSIFCEGGARTLNELLRVKRIDVIHQFIGEKNFGAGSPSSPHCITHFSPEDQLNWECSTLCEFGNDHLQEWLKCS